MQNVKFSEKFLTDASQFGLHLDTETTGPFQHVTGEITVAKVIDLTDTYIFVMASGHVLALDGSIGMSFPVRWTTKVVETVEELAEFIKVRRAVQTARWS